MDILLGIATLLGGIAAAWYFWDKYKQKHTKKENDKEIVEKWKETTKKVNTR